MLLCGTEMACSHDVFVWNKFRGRLLFSQLGKYSQLAVVGCLDGDLGCLFEENLEEVLFDCVELRWCNVNVCAVNNRGNFKVLCDFLYFPDCTAPKC